MSKKQEFINYVKELMTAVPDMSPNEEAKIYWDAFCNKEEVEKPKFTDNGKLVLRFLQENQEVVSWKAKDIAEGLLVSSRTVSGAMRKLTSDGYTEKISQDPVIYSLTELGKNVKIDD